MKTTICTFLLFVGLAVAATTQAQDAPQQGTKSQKTTIKVRILEEKDGKSDIIERTYHYNDLSEAEQEAKIKAIVDSLQTKTPGVASRRLSIEVQQGDEQPFDDKFEHDAPARADRMKRIEKDLKPKMEKIEREFKTFGQQFKYDFNHAWKGSVFDPTANKPASVRGLEAYPNNPDKNELNLRFYVPNKGDIRIAITDTKGKQVATKEVKDFSGDFVGQVELGKNPKGTYFITVTQNEDGAVKRIVIE